MKDDLLRGGGLIVLATILFSISDAMAKYVTASVPPVELATIRYAVFVVMAGLPFLRSRRPSLRTRRPGLQILRGVGVAGSAILFIIALGTLPIAEATAINFVTPLLVTVLAIPVLGEVVRPQGWAAVLMGFVGMLIVVRPGLGGFHPAALLVLGSSLCWCMATLITRRIAGIDRTEVTLLWTAVTGLVLMLGALPFFLAPLTLTQLGFCIAVGVVATGGQWCALLAYRYARATVLAPLTYVQLIWSSALGLLVFHTIPDQWVFLGAAVIAASGTYVLHLERVRVRGTGTGTGTGTGNVES